MALAVVLGVLARLHSPSALWLDEALSVNIAALPLAELPDALRQDGAPPVYYVLLHVWMDVFGSGDRAVRALSVLFALLALPLAWLCGRRLHSAVAGTTALLLLASNPFAVRYATEARMYSLVVLLVLAGVLALHAALREPTPSRLAPVTGLATLLALTHYWALFLLAVVGAGLAAASVRGPVRAAARRCLVAVALAGLLFLPWLPVFLFQSQHTGTPWADAPAWSQLLLTWQRWSGPGLPGVLLGLLLLALALSAPFARRWRDRDGAQGLLLRLPVVPLGGLLAGSAVATLLLGLAVTIAQSSGYALRYSAVALGPALLAAAVGAQALPSRARTTAVAVAVVLGTATAVQAPFDRTRTQAAVTAEVLRPLLGPGDLVLYCPDQLGPAVSRLLPQGTDQLVYPTGGPPERVDWVDYAERNADDDPVLYAATASRRAEGALWLVVANGYRTYGQSCRALDAALTQARGSRRVLVLPRAGYGEKQALVRYPQRPAQP